MSVHFSSKSSEWETPQELFDSLRLEFGFTLDVAASKQNHKCSRYFTKSTNGLSRSWADESVWMNPPYGREIGKWMAKALRESKRTRAVVCLVPARTDTSWWHDYAMKGEIRFLRGRLKFNGHKNSAPFPSAIVIFKP